MRVGPFELQQRIGGGGMGEVWRATHPEAGDVAIKTLGQDRQSEVQKLRFWREVQAVAVLDHPAIVSVLNAGTDPPWMAMELVPGGTLASHPPSDWRGIRAVLVALLQALGHAHARGLVHRDLKPSNVLRGEDGWKLADFGIAHRPDQWSDDAHFGTAAYMAPEQIRGQWRDFGPWTDLYALGCVAWQLLTGEPPFTGEPDEVAFGHLNLPPGRLPPATVGPSLDAWMGRCLAKRPAQRFTSAAEALWALDGAQPPPGLPQHPQVVAVRAHPLRGTGLGLYGVRSRRLVGRAHLQDALWQAARRQAQAGRMELLLLRGPVGSGKSALCRWLCEQLRVEGGVAWSAHHAPDAATDGPAELLRAAYTARGLGRLALAERLAYWGQAHGSVPAELGQLLERLAPQGISQAPTSLPSVTLGPARHQVVTDALLCVAQGRPVAVWLDDLQWGDIGIDWVQAQLGCPGPLVVATLQEQALAEAPHPPALQALLTQPGVTVLEVGPLVREHWAPLVCDLLGLHDSLALRVEERTHGNPLFATQLVGDWVQRGLLEPQRGGYRLRQGAVVDLPRTMADTWRSRITQLLHGLGPHERQSLFVAALLGDSVDQEEWQASCEALGIQPSVAAIRRGLTASLLRPTAEGWRFVHSVFREALVARVDVAQRQLLHDACAEAIAARAEDLERSERVARHRLAGADPCSALEPLCDAAMQRQRHHDFRGAQALLDERELLLARLDPPASHPAWADGWAQRARLMCASGDPYGSLPLMRQVLVHARAYGWRERSVQCALLAVGLLAGAGQVQEALPLFDELRPQLRTANERAGFAESLATLQICQHRSDQAVHTLQAALDDEAEVGVFRRVSLWVRMLGAQAHRGDQRAAHLAYEQVVRWTTQSGEVKARADAEEAMGALYHMKGELAQALSHYQAAVETGTEGGVQTSNYQMNRCLVLVLLHRWQEAEELWPAVDEAIPQGHTIRRALVAGMQLRMAAPSWERGAFGALVGRWAETLGAIDLVDSDLASLAEGAAVDVAGRGWTDLAAQLQELAAGQRAAL